MYIYIYIYVFICACIYLWISIYVFTCLCIYIRIYVYTYAYKYTRGAHKDAFVVVEAVGQREREARGALLVQIPVERHLPNSTAVD